MPDENESPVQPTRRVLVMNFGPPDRAMVIPVPTDVRVIAYKTAGTGCGNCRNLGLLRSAGSINTASVSVHAGSVPSVGVYQFDTEQEALDWAHSVENSFDVVTFIDNN